MSPSPDSVLDFIKQILSEHESGGQLSNLDDRSPLTEAAQLLLPLVSSQMSRVDELSKRLDMVHLDVAEIRRMFQEVSARLSSFPSDDLVSAAVNRAQVDVGHMRELIRLLESRLNEMSEMTTLIRREVEMRQVDVSTSYLERLHSLTSRMDEVANLSTTKSEALRSAFSGQIHAFESRLQNLESRIAGLAVMPDSNGQAVISRVEQISEQQSNFERMLIARMEELAKRNFSTPAEMNYQIGTLEAKLSELGSQINQASEKQGFYNGTSPQFNNVIPIQNIAMHLDSRVGNPPPFDPDLSFVSVFICDHYDYQSKKEHIENIVDELESNRYLVVRIRVTKDTDRSVVYESMTAIINHLADLQSRTEKRISLVVDDDSDECRTLFGRDEQHALLIRDGSGWILRGVQRALTEDYEHLLTKPSGSYITSEDLRDKYPKYPSLRSARITALSRDAIVLLEVPSKSKLRRYLILQNCIDRIPMHD